LPTAGVAEVWDESSFDRAHGKPHRGRHSIAEEHAEGEGEMTQNRSLLLGIGIGLFGALAVLTLRYVCAVLAG
jgi:hypothetical protein